MAAESVTQAGGVGACGGGVGGGGAERQTGIGGRCKRAPGTYKKFLLMVTDGDLTYVYEGLSAENIRFRGCGRDGEDSGVWCLPGTAEN